MITGAWAVDTKSFTKFDNKTWGKTFAFNRSGNVEDVGVGGGGTGTGSGGGRKFLDTGSWRWKDESASSNAIR
jgi:hypothetical protein